MRRKNGGETERGAKRGKQDRYRVRSIEFSKLESQT